MPTPQTPEMWDLAAKAVRQYMRDQERLLRDLLGQWVSEIEPSIIYGNSTPPQIKGIGVADDPTGTVIIKNPKFSPGLMDMIPPVFGPSYDAKEIGITLTMSDETRRQIEEIENNSRMAAYNLRNFVMD